MNDAARGLPFGPPWSLDLLADLHAGAVDPALAEVLRTRVEADPRAVAVLRALDATGADLSRLAAAPPLRTPDRVAARIDAALAGLTAGPQVVPAPARPTRGGPSGPPPERAAGRPRRVRRRAHLAVLAVAAAAAVVLGVAIPASHITGTPVAAGSGGTPLALSEAEVPTALGPALRSHDLGPLADRAVLAGCLRAHGVDPGTAVLGARQVRLAGQPGVLLVLPTDRANEYHVLVVGAACGPGGPATLAERVVGG